MLPLIHQKNMDRNLTNHLGIKKSRSVIRLIAIAGKIVSHSSTQNLSQTSRKLAKIQELHQPKDKLFTKILNIGRKSKKTIPSGNPDLSKIPFISAINIPFP
jgi:hypothetical protein